MIDYELLKTVFLGISFAQYAGLETALFVGSLLTSAGSVAVQHEKMEDAEEARKRARRRREKIRKKKEKQLQAQQRRERRERSEDQKSLARRAQATGRQLLLSSDDGISEGITETLG